MKDLERLEIAYHQYPDFENKEIFEEYFTSYKPEQQHIFHKLKRIKFRYF